MSREIGSSLVLTTAADNGSYHLFRSLAGFVSAGTWDDAKNGAFAAFAPFTNEKPSTVGTSGDPTFAFLDFTTGRGGGVIFALTRTILTVDVSAINKTTFPNGLGEVYMSLGSANRFRQVNTSSDHRFCIARPSADLQTEINTSGVGFTCDAGDWSKIDGWGGNLVDNSSNITLYADLDQTVVATYFNGVTTGNSSATILPLLKLNEQAKADILENDFFVCWLMDYDHDVRYRDPQTESPSAGAAVRITTSIFTLETGTSGRPSFGFAGRAYVFGRNLTSPQPAAPDVIANDFTFNTFADVSDQRGRIFKTTELPGPNLRPDLPSGKHLVQENIDQVPFVLGVKGPLSLRGREFTNEGIPISTTVDPPRTIKNSKD